MKGYGLGYSCMSFCFLWDWSVLTWKMREFTMTSSLSVSTEPRFVSSTIDRAEESLWSSRCSSNFRKKQGFGGSSRLNTMWMHNNTYSPWHLDSKNQRETRTRQVTQECANRRRQQTETIHQRERERERESQRPPHTASCWREGRSNVEQSAWHQKPKAQTGQPHLQQIQETQYSYSISISIKSFQPNCLA